MEIVSSNRAGTRNVNKVTAMLLFEAAFFKGTVSAGDSAHWGY